MTKEFWKSKTLWFNVLALIVAIATAFGYGSQEPPEWLGPAATVAVAIINMIIRTWGTSTKLTFGQ